MIEENLRSKYPNRPYHNSNVCVRQGRARVSGASACVRGERRTGGWVRVADFCGPGATGKRPALATAYWHAFVVRPCAYLGVGHHHHTIGSNSQADGQLGNDDLACQGRRRRGGGKEEETAWRVAHRSEGGGGTGEGEGCHERARTLAKSFKAFGRLLQLLEAFGLHQQALHEVPAHGSMPCAWSASPGRGKRWPCGTLAPTAQWWCGCRGAARSCSAQ
jgi:hypothetical protein